MAAIDEKPRTTSWGAQYYAEQKRQSSTRNWRSILHPSVLLAVCGVAGRCMIAPLVVLIVCITTGYFTSATFFIEAKDSYFAYSQLDPIMRGGCHDCLSSCRKVFFQLGAFGNDAIISMPAYENSQVVANADAAAGDYSKLTLEEIALADKLDTDGAVCSVAIGAVNDWGTPNVAIGSTAEGILSVVNTLGLALAPQMKRELEAAVEQKDKCESRWNLGVVLRLHKFQTVKNSADYSSISVADFNTYPDYADCRPDIPNEGIVGMKLAYPTNGEDLLSVVPDKLKQFPYEFESSSLPTVSRYIKTVPTIHGFTTVTQPLMRSYFAGCRVRVVNTTGVYVEDGCTLIDHWRSYGLTLQSPDDLPVCSTGDVCVHNMYNTVWEYTNFLSSADPTRVIQIISVFRSRYADSVALSMLPGAIVAQILSMGIVSLYQVMSSKRSVLLTQIWAYRCQNGRMQAAYLAQVMYHFAFNSDMYYLGLSTGTLSSASIMNLALSFFAFSYSFINVIKARSGEQALDRDFRLLWETVILVATGWVAGVLLTLRYTSLSFIGDLNGELLRRTSALGAKYCGLKDSCYVFIVNLGFIITAAALALGLLTSCFAIMIKYCRRRGRGANKYRVNRAIVAGEDVKVKEMTTFEENCLGVPFTRLFKDCNDFAYVTYMNKRCTTVEVILLTGYLFYGEHVYQATAVVLLLVARLVPRKFLRTFNQLLLRWHYDPQQGTLSYAKSCTWYSASAENYKLSEAMPLA
ncbi:hypothetical protein PC129_g13439 [Phytophthora cactorum]|uniref:Uncharacterized protein n=2 Tax=Phytophthora cactorum TaxID=29920 RepID=A0A8T1FJA3_9STRA|nr:hypothetical protein Pcac1_g16808 [Phytophthora cactorum]KAG2809321.1 hypothetical protein PC111_g16106 [Phytophthora cactorum]KAG2893908.1 hypothetical protein PC114_g16108 [Phytophthora cactorum]KAG2913867.1 hypothetical protein PC117_g18494 [Phytophthora cactorum]KAG2974063.1 hypothetical protein PC118_g14763 [Phytophthora cactorum]